MDDPLPFGLACFHAGDSADLWLAARDTGSFIFTLIFQAFVRHPHLKKYKSKYSGAVSMHFVPAIEMGFLYPRGRIFFFFFQTKYSLIY